METTSSGITTYERSVDHANDISPIAAEEKQHDGVRSLPPLFWAVTILFLVNAVIALGVWFSPELRVGVYGEETDESVVAYRPSPFTEVVETGSKRPVKMAMKVHPVITYEEPQPFEAVSLGLPRSTTSGTSLTVYSASQPRSTSGAAVNRIVESYSDYPRMSAALDVPRATMTVHTGTVDIAPRRASERMLRTN